MDHEATASSEHQDGVDEAVPEMQYSLMNGWPADLEDFIAEQVFNILPANLVEPMREEPQANSDERDQDDEQEDETNEDTDKFSDFDDLDDASDTDYYMLMRDFDILTSGEPFSLEGFLHSIELADNVENSPNQA